MRRLHCVLGALGFLFASRSIAEESGRPVGPPTAMSLVRQALDADLAGDSPQRAALLQKALALWPMYAPARWYSGQLLHAQQWLPVREVQQSWADNAQLREYFQQRAALGDSVAAHKALARYCRKQKWREREGFHWRQVLRLRNFDKEATEALGLTKYRGMWLTKEEIARFRAASDRAEAALNHWQPLLAKLQEAINGDDPQAREDAVTRLQQISDPAAIPAIAASLYQCSEAYALAATTLLSTFDDQIATDLLVWISIDSPHESVRDIAICALRPRPLHSFVPALMGALASPLELSYYVNSFEPGELSHGFVLVRDTPNGELSYTIGRGSNYRWLTRLPMVRLGTYERARTLQWASAVGSLSSIQESVAAANAVTEEQNERIYQVLRETTGQRLHGAPQAWWKWWEEHNELFVAGRNRRRVRCNLRYPMPFWPTSCFIPGTPVWTETGVRPIETIRPGDRVLSQNPDTGELDWKFVLETTLRPASPTLRVQVKGETIIATRGHPFWVAGKGWRMTKELDPSDRLYTIEGAASVDELGDGPEWEAHNLVVEGFGTYFVGNTGLLVRDNALRGVPMTPLPGYEVVAADASE